MRGASFFVDLISKFVIFPLLTVGGLFILCVVVLAMQRNESKRKDSE